MFIYIVNIKKDICFKRVNIFVRFFFFLNERENYFEFFGKEKKNEKYLYVYSV